MSAGKTLSRLARSGFGQPVNRSGSDARSGDQSDLDEQRPALILFGWGNRFSSGTRRSSTNRRDSLGRGRAQWLLHLLLGLGLRSRSRGNGFRRYFGILRRGRICSAGLVLAWHRLQRALRRINGGAGLLLLTCWLR